jgi:acetylornithine/N-succinyldiaminopimelate aminotransferase
MAISSIAPVYNRSEIWFDHGEGAYLYDKDGVKYLDFLSGIAVNALGHSHPHLVSELTKQAAKVWHVSNIFYTEPLRKLSERLVEATFADSVFFCNSGTEAIEAGIKAVRKHFDEIGQPDRYRIITFEGAFHGRTMGAASATGTQKILEGFEPRLDGFDKVPVDIEAVKKAITPQTAAILIEPVQGEGGISTLPIQLLPELRKICDENGLLLFLDEVQCGVGRTGKFFGFEYAGVEPDLVSIAKGIGGGFPLGGLLMKEKVAKTLKTGSHGTTFGGNPLATAVGNAVLDVILEKGFLENVQKKAEKLKTELQTLQNKYPNMIEEIRGIGLILGIKLKEPFVNDDLKNALIKNKLIVNTAGQNVVRILPPLIIDDSHIEEAVDIIDRTLATFR